MRREDGQIMCKLRARTPTPPRRALRGGDAVVEGRWPFYDIAHRAAAGRCGWVARREAQRRGTYQSGRVRQGGQGGGGRRRTGHGGRRRSEGAKTGGRRKRARAGERRKCSWPLRVTRATAPTARSAPSLSSLSPARPDRTRSIPSLPALPLSPALSPCGPYTHTLASLEHPHHDPQPRGSVQPAVPAPRARR